MHCLCVPCEMDTGDSLLSVLPLGLAMNYLGFLGGTLEAPEAVPLVSPQKFVLL
jgi:hypothetical protein